MQRQTNILILNATDLLVDVIETTERRADGLPSKVLGWLRPALVHDLIDEQGFLTAKGAELGAAAGSQSLLARALVRGGADDSAAIVRPATRLPAMFDRLQASELAHWRGFLDRVSAATRTANDNLDTPGFQASRAATRIIANDAATATRIYLAMRSAPAFKSAYRNEFQERVMAMPAKRFLQLLDESRECILLGNIHECLGRFHEEMRKQPEPEPTEDYAPAMRM